MTKIYYEGISVVDDVSMSCEARTITTLRGPSGAGKSTLLRLLAALERPSSGSVAVGSHDLRALTIDSAQFRREVVGYVSQTPMLVPYMSAWENVIAGAAGGSTLTEAGRAADRLLDKLGLSNRRDYVPGELSGGQQRRVSVARGLIRRVPILLLDEPTSQLDDVSGRLVASAIADARDEGRCILCASHDRSLADVADQVLVMDGGQLREPG